MKLRHVLLALPLLTACEDAPTLVSGASFRADASPFSYDAPITAEGFVAGADGVQLHYRIVGSGPDS
ncbi:MAG TPA: hypothetical protein VFX98_08560, partial [Longimicrobiaceae bacterium]|nr:hypothetical protein [Longimicrobiaceae bacterium]